MQHLATIILILTQFFGCSQYPSSQPIKHIRLIWDDAPSQQATLSWTGLGGDVRYEVELYGGEIDSSKPEILTNYLSGEYKNAVSLKQTTTAFYYHVNLENLEPSTKYFVKIKSSTNESPIHYFITAPVDGDWQLIVGGDSRSNRQKRTDINRQIKKTFHNNQDIIALLHGGDFVDSGSVWNQWGNWLRDHEETYTDDRRLLPIIPTRGNHESDEELYNQIYPYPSSNWFQPLIKWKRV